MVSKEARVTEEISLEKAVDTRTETVRDTVRHTEVEVEDERLDREVAAREPREVQPGFQDAAPGLVPDMKEDPAPDLPETPGGRFAKQIAEAPEEGQDKPRPK